MPEEYYESDFPDLHGLGFKRTSEPAYYNCIAFVLGDYKRKWWPGDYHPRWSIDYWPIGAPIEETLEAFVAALQTKDFQVCADDSWEPEFVRIALYAREQAIKHAALQIDEKTWMSKLGPDEDIQHTLPGLEGPLYGKVVAYLKRPRILTSEPTLPR